MVNISTNSLEKTRCPPKTKKLGLHLEKRSQVSGYDEVWMEISTDFVTGVISSLVISIFETTNARNDIINFYLPNPSTVENMSIEPLLSAIKPVNTKKNEIENLFRQDKKTTDSIRISRFAT